MEPTKETQKPTWETAEKVGGQRIEVLVKWAKRLAAPDVMVQMGASAVQEGANAVREKWEKSETKKNLEVFLEKGEKAANRLWRRFDRFKDRTITAGKEQAKRAAILGLSPVGGGESLVELVGAGLPEIIDNFRKGRAEKSIEQYKEAIKKAQESVAKRSESIKGHHERRKKMRPVRGLIEKLQTKG